MIRGRNKQVMSSCFRFLSGEISGSLSGKMSGSARRIVGVGECDGRRKTKRRVICD